MIEYWFRASSGCAKTYGDSYSVCRDFKHLLNRALKIVVRDLRSVTCLSCVAALSRGNVLGIDP